MSSSETKHTCISCRKHSALPKQPHCEVCFNHLESTRDIITQQILKLEEKYCVSFTRTDETWVKHSDGVDLLYSDPTDIPRSNQSSFPAAEEVIDLQDHQYDIVD